MSESFPFKCLCRDDRRFWKNAAAIVTGIQRKFMLRLADQEEICAVAPRCIRWSILPVVEEREINMY